MWRPRLPFGRITWEGTGATGSNPGSSMPWVYDAAVNLVPIKLNFLHLHIGTTRWTCLPECSWGLTIYKVLDMVPGKKPLLVALLICITVCLFSCQTPYVMQLCRKEFNLAQKEVWDLSSVKTMTSGRGLATPGRPTVWFRIVPWGWRLRPAKWAISHVYVMEPQ